ncbi:MAG: FAD-dependent oxidoreductase [Crenarchaeota archaeon]|nr:FAD-dependent oxidoreductase [Thermoproteota archaeon]
MMEKVGRKVAILGSGPAGLQAADYLSSRGVEVHVYDRLPEIGGMMMFAIPERRIPKKKLVQRRVELERRGVVFNLGVKVQEGEVRCEGDEIIRDVVSFRQLVDKYDALLICTGAWRSRMLGIEGEEGLGVYPALEFIFRIRLRELGYTSQEPDIGERVVVVGAGRTAVDVVEELCLRKRKVILIYRRRLAESRAYRELSELTRRYSIEVFEERNPVKIIIDRGRVTGIEACKVVRVGDRFQIDEKDRVVIDCDSVIEAIGEEPTPPVDEKTAYMFNIEIERGKIKVDENFRTRNPKIYAAGDVVLGPSSIGQAVGTGLKAAKSIELYLREKL